MLPIFCSEAQARILAWLLPHPDREQPIATLAAVAGTAEPNVLRHPGFRHADAAGTARTFFYPA